VTTASASAASGPGVSARGIRSGWDSWPWLPAGLVAAVGALAFVAVRPGVGDLFAAEARQSAASNGVGLTYWFSWYAGGSVPGGYSVLAPPLSALFGAALLGAISTVALTPLVWKLAHGTRRPAAATWIATLAAGMSLWSGRIPFAVGCVAATATLIAVRARHRLWGAAGAALTVALSPVSAALLLPGLVGGFVASRSHRSAIAWAALASLAMLSAITIAFGAPGPQGFSPDQAVVACAVLAGFLCTRPSRPVSVVVLVSLAVCPILALVPNSFGSNFERMIWICLPPAVIGTARAGRPIVIAVVLAALGWAGYVTTSELVVAAKPPSTTAYYAPLTGRLRDLGGLANYRLEVVPDGTHTAAYALLNYAMLARGYETQAENAYNKALDSAPQLDPARYRAWLDDNAVGYVAIDNSPTTTNAEYNLVAGAPPSYLELLWHNANWRLFEVVHPTPIVSAPATIVDADQANLELSIPRAGTFLVRVRWSRYLSAAGPAETRPAELQPTPDGWTALTIQRPGRYSLFGR
jgi:hypothetical protein